MSNTAAFCFEASQQPDVDATPKRWRNFDVSYISTTHIHGAIAIYMCVSVPPFLTFGYGQIATLIFHFILLLYPLSLELLLLVPWRRPSYYSIIVDSLGSTLRSKLVPWISPNVLVSSDTS